MPKGIRNIDRGETTGMREVSRVEEPDYVYVPPSLLQIPDFADKDQYSYRWVRVTLGNEEDNKNIMMRLREGYTFVKIGDLPEGTAFDMVAQQRGSSLLEGTVRVGDVALAKIPRHKSLAYKRYVEGLAAAQAAAVSQRAISANVDDHVAVLDNSESRSSVVRGKRVAFAD